MRPDSAVDRAAANKDLDPKHPAKNLKAANCLQVVDKKGQKCLKFTFMGQDNQ